MRPYDYGGQRVHDEAALNWVETVWEQLDEQQFAIAEDMLSEIYERLFFLMNVGLHYLTLSRTAPSLSGGEGQRVRLQLGCGVMGGAVCAG